MERSTTESTRATHTPLQLAALDSSELFALHGCQEVTVKVLHSPKGIFEFQASDKQAESYCSF